MKSYPKPKRIVDKKLIESIRSIGICELIGVGECWGGLDVHHIKSKGSGGDDVEENLALLCRRHHNLMGAKKISLETLRERQEFRKRLTL